MPAIRTDPMPPVPKYVVVDGQNIPIYMPFYYASLSSMWVYYAVDPAVLKPYLEGTGFTAALFEGQAVVNVDFQNYTGHGGAILETCNEVEFNVVAYPDTRANQVPDLTLAEFLAGEDQTKTLGQLRLHVPADNPVAVAAGIALFGEPKFLAAFQYEVPALNDPPAKRWQYTCLDAAPAGQTGEKIFGIEADLHGLTATPGNSSSMTEYSLLDGRPIGSHWDMFGVFQTYLLPGEAADRVTLSYGLSENPMRHDMHRIIGHAPAVAVQLFVSTPVAAESRAYYVDLPDGAQMPDQAVVARTPSRKPSAAG